MWSGNTILYVEKPGDFIKIKELTNKFSKVSGYKIQHIKSLLFLHSSNETAEKKIKKVITFTKIAKNE